MATEAMEGHHDSCEQDGSKDQLIHLQTARVPKVPLISKPVWEELSSFPWNPSP